jgi:Sulfotransferase family
MHMEKCGGTSMGRLLREEYGDNFFAYDPGPSEAHREPVFPDATRCVHGHMFHGLHDHFPDQHCDYVTLLRDPVDRFLSNFDHVRRYEHPLHPMVMRPDGLEFFCSDYSARHYRNLFVRRLAGVWDEVESSDLDRAEQVVRSFAVVGDLANVAAFVKACAARFGWQHRSLGHLNAAPSVRLTLVGFSEAQRRQVVEANRWDLELMSRISDVVVR